MKAQKALIGLAVAMTLALAAVPAGAATVCTATKPKMVDHTGTDGSECIASAFGKSKAHSSADGSKSFAEADAQTGSKATATASGANSFSEAGADSHGHSTSHAMGDGSQANADTDEHGKAKAMANGTSAEADSSAFGNCKSTSMASGTGSQAIANCTHSGTFVNATATGGGLAQGSDDAPPTCTPGAGTASVHSSGGDC